MTVRVQHTKAHGCVVANFKVYDKLDPKFEHGIFQKSKQYDAIIRFSNGHHSGISLKLLLISQTFKIFCNLFCVMMCVHCLVV